jgi:hypothetical protein
MLIFASVAPFQSSANCHHQRYTGDVPGDNITASAAITTLRIITNGSGDHQYSAVTQR